MNTTPRTHLAAVAAVAVVACGTAACSSSHPSSSTSTTGHGGASARPASASTPITLRLGTDDRPDMPGAVQVRRFAASVAELSDGAITVEPVWQADDGQPHWDQAVAKMLFDGELDLAMIPSRAWDDLGVTSLSALTAPFVVTTDTLTASIVSDDHLVGQLTSGLSAAGVSALGLYPEGLRHPFGFDAPLRGAADYRGGLVRGPWSRTTNAMFEALGATYTDVDADTGKMIGAESSYRLSPAGQATGNVTFFPKVNTLVIDDDSRDGLSEDQLSVLQEAADSTRTWVLDSLPTDAEAAATFCAETGKIASASGADIESLVAATQPVVEQLRQDPTTATLLDEIAVLAKADPAAEPVKHCPREEQSDASLVNGTYAFTMTADQARAAGVTDQGMIDENAGDYVITFADGTYQLTQVYSTGPKAGTTTHGAGGYQLTATRLKWFWSHEPGEWTEVDVAVEDDGSLDFTNVHDGGDAQTQALSEAFYTHWDRTKD